MEDHEFNVRAITILHHMTLEHENPIRRFFGRWRIADEPLRHDAANLLREMGETTARPANSRVLTQPKFEQEGE